MAGGLKALIVAMQVLAIMAAALSGGAFAQDGGVMPPAEGPVPEQGAGCTLQISTAAMASAVAVSLWAIMKN